MVILYSKKHRITQACMEVLGMMPRAYHFSKGGTVTRDAWLDVALKLMPDRRFALQGLIKQDLACEVLRFLGIYPDPSWFSRGSTVTEDAWHAMLPLLKDKHSA